jgi:hypothetical protein
VQWLSRALQDCSGGFVGRLACLLSSHPAQHTTKPKKQLAKTPIDGNVSYLSIAHAPPEALTAKRREQTARSGREASGDSICPCCVESIELPASCCFRRLNFGVLGRGATDHGRMDAEVGQPATASDPPGPVAPAPLDDGHEITAAMIKAAVKHEKPVVLSADQASPHIRGRCYTLVRVVLEAVYRRQGYAAAERARMARVEPAAAGAASALALQA